MASEEPRTGAKGRRSPWAIIVLVPFILALLWVGIGNVSSSLEGVTVDHQSALRIVACNLNAASVEAERVTPLLIHLDADVICLFEWTGRNLDLDSMLGNRYKVGLNDPQPGASGTCILMREDIEGICRLVKNPAAECCRIPIATIRITGDRGSLSILGVHAPPPTKTCGSDNRRTLDALARWIRAGRLTTSTGAASEADPVILAGDLNAIPYSAQIRQLRRSGLQDAWSAAHLRPILTWRPSPLLPRLAQLDYIMAGEPLDIRGCWVIGVPGSDHCLVMADIDVAEEGQ